MYPADLASEEQCCNKSNSNGHAWLYGRPEDISNGRSKKMRNENCRKGKQQFMPPLFPKPSLLLTLTQQPQH